VVSFSEVLDITTQESVLFLVSWNIWISHGLVELQIEVYCQMENDDCLGVYLINWRFINNRIRLSGQQAMADFQNCTQHHCVTKTKLSRRLGIALTETKCSVYTLDSQGFHLVLSVRGLPFVL
jgi:hypothetical protein